MILRQIGLCWIFVSKKRTKQFPVTKIIWIYFVWWALSNWHTRNFVEHCVLLWLCSRRKFKTNFDVQGQFSVILPIQRVLCAWSWLSSPGERASESQTTHTCWYIFNSDSVMVCNTATRSVTNTLKKIYLSENPLNELNSKYYDDKNGFFEISF